MTSSQDSVSDNLTEASSSNAATISKHKNPTVRSSKQQSNNSQIKRKILVAGNSMLNNIHERGFSKQNTVKVENFPGTTTETILENLENLLEFKPDMLIVHAGTNGIPKNINPLNNLRKVHRKCLELSPETKLVFSNIIFRKDKKNLDKHRKDVNARMNNFCKHKDIGKNILHFIES